MPGRKPSKNAVLPYPVGFDEAYLVLQVEIKKSAFIYKLFFSHAWTKRIKKTVTKSEQKVKTLEAKPFDENAEKKKRLCVRWLWVIVVLTPKTIGNRKRDCA